MKIKFILSLSIIALILGSCGSSNEVVGGGIFQKRKYNKGYYWNRNSNDATSKNESDTKRENENLLGNVEEKKSANSTVLHNDSDDVIEKTATAHKGENNVDKKDVKILESSALSSTENKDQSGIGALIKKTTTHKAIENKMTKKLEQRANPPGNGNTGNILMLILLIILIIVVFTLLDSLLGGILSWILGIVILVLIIYFLLRLLGVV